MSDFGLLSTCVYVTVELQVTPWPRTSAVFTCFCKRKSLTVTTFPEKYDTRVFLGEVGVKLWGVGGTVLPFSYLPSSLSLSFSLFSESVYITVKSHSRHLGVKSMFFCCISEHVANVSNDSVTPLSPVHLFYNCTIRKAPLSSCDCIVKIWLLITIFRNKNNLRYIWTFLNGCHI